jgi:YHS domain-containing protein
MNSFCPITGEPIDPQYSIVFEEKVIGFCCPNCPKQFWENPEGCLEVLENQ